MCVILRSKTIRRKMYFIEVHSQSLLIPDVYEISNNVNTFNSIYFTLVTYWI